MMEEKFFKSKNKRATSKRGVLFARLRVYAQMKFGGIAKKSVILAKAGIQKLKWRFTRVPLVIRIFFGSRKSGNFHKYDKNYSQNILKEFDHKFFQHRRVRFSHAIYKGHPCKPCKSVFSLSGLVMLIIATGISSLILSLVFPNVFKIRAANNTMVQTDWSDGASTTATSTNTSDQTGWKKYNAASSTINFGTAGEISLSASSTTFSETFSATSYKDTTTSTAAWTGGQVTTSSILDSNVTDLSAKITSIWGSSTRMVIGLAYDSINNVVYMLGSIGQFGKYNVAAATVTMVSSSIQSFWGTNQGNALAVDSANGAVYLGGNLGNFAKYNIAAGTATSATSSIFGFWRTNNVNALALDSANGAVYLGGNGGKFAKYIIADGTATSATSSITPFWGNSIGVAALALDSTNGAVYLGGNGGKFAKYIIADGTASLATSSLATAGSSWATSDIAALAYDPADGLIFLGNSVGNFAKYTIADGTVTDLTSLISGFWAQDSVHGFYNLIYDSANGVVYLGGNTAMFAQYHISSNTVVNLSSKISPLTVPIAGVYIPNSSILYLAGTSKKFVSKTVSCSTCQAVSLTFDNISQNIRSALLTKNDTPGTGAVAYQLSNDGGTTYTTVTAGTTSTFSSTGSDARFKIMVTGKATVQDVTVQYDNYPATSTLISSPFDTEQSGNVVGNLAWTETLPAGTDIKFQIRTSGDGVTWSDWLGPTGTSDYYSNPAGNTINSTQTDGANDRYVQYQVWLTSSGANTPTLSDTTLTYSGPSNTAPTISGSPSDGGSDGTTPTNVGSNVTFTATYTDAESDQYYLAICKTSAVTAGTNAAPTCDGGAWGISTATNSGSQASVATTTYSTDAESNVWYAFACDKVASGAACSSASQGSGSTGSPFKVNHAPTFTSINDATDPLNVGSDITFTTVASDADVDTAADTVNLYVCKANDATSAGCGAGGTWCSALTAASNPTCGYTTLVGDAGTLNYYAYVFDQHNVAASANPRSSTFTVSNQAPVITVAPSDGGSDGTTPTNVGANVTFTVKATDADTDQYYLAVCKTNAVTAGNNAAPTCDAGTWAISGATNSGAQASANYTALVGDGESNAWYAFVCDKTTNGALCSAASQGSGSTGSPFKVNHAPTFTSITDATDPLSVGSDITFTTVASDSDSDTAQDTVNLYVCKANDATSSGCGAGGTWCSALTAASNPTCGYTTLVGDAGTLNYYAYIYDQHNFESSDNPRSSTFTVNAAATAGGNSLPLSSLPAPTVTQNGIIQPLQVFVNNNQESTASNLVDLTLNGGNAVNMAISNDANFTLIGQEPYRSSKKWDICFGLDFCTGGVRTVYVKFYSSSGASTMVSDSIVYKPFSLEQPKVIVEAPLVAAKPVTAPSPPMPTKEQIQKAKPGLVNEIKKEPIPLVLKNLGLLKLPIKPIKELVGAPFSKQIAALAQKFPTLQQTFSKIGVKTMSDLQKLENSQVALPGLSKFMGSLIGGKSVSPTVAKLIDNFTPRDKANMPAGVVFARSADEKVDFNISLTVDPKTKEFKQTITTVSNQTLKLVVKPESKAKRVRGLLSVKNTKKQTSFLESLISFLVKPANAQTTEYIVREFEYTDSDKDGIYTADLKIPSVEGEYEVITLIEYEDIKLGQKELRLVTVVDPEGYVFRKDGEDETRVKNATVSIFYLNLEKNTYELWPADQFHQENPQITDKTGRYSFLVPEGTYYLAAEAKNYQSYVGQPFVVKDGMDIHENIEMQKNHWWTGLFDKLKF